jgi:hypothetical protein
VLLPSGDLTYDIFITVFCVVQADVFSFGVMMYEVMHRYIMLSAVSIQGTYEELEQYAARVAAGYRPPLHTNMPPSITSIIQVNDVGCSAFQRISNSNCLPSSCRL